MQTSEPGCAGGGPHCHRHLSLPLAAAAPVKCSGGLPRGDIFVCGGDVWDGGEEERGGKWKGGRGGVRRGREKEEESGRGVEWRE